MFGLTILLASVLGVATVTTAGFKSLLAHHISNDVLRIITIGFFFLVSCFGFVWGCTALVFGNMFPTTTRGINDDYSFTMQPYGMAFTSSQGYDLVFYRDRSLWFDQELGKIQLECASTEAISATVVPGHNNVNRLLIKADNATVLDTMLNFDRVFNFKHSTSY